jgi:hypothetical protein
MRLVEFEIRKIGREYNVSKSPWRFVIYHLGHDFSMKHGKHASPDGIV